MSEQPVPPSDRRRQRKRRRAVWRPGEGISSTVETRPPVADVAPSADVADVPPETPEPSTPAAPEAKRPAGRRPRSDAGERGLRELVGAGPSQVGPVRAMRARDLNRPTDADLAQAADEVTLVRRHWKPPRD